MLASEKPFSDSAVPTAVLRRVICYGGTGNRWQSLGQTDAPNLFVDVRDAVPGKDKASLAQGAIFGVTEDSLKKSWNRSAPPGYPFLEAFVQLRPVVVD